MEGDDTELARLYLDFDSFFATAEQHFNPALRGQPVGVVPLDSAHTGCIAISREAKALGLKFGATIRDAKERAPHMIFVVARPDAYVRLHNRILSVIETCVPIAEIRSIDEVVCHLLPSEAAQAEELAHRIKAALSTHFSPILTCSIGIAKTELLAKIGAEMEKPDGLVMIRQSNLPHHLSHLSLTDLPGISAGIESRLKAAGVHTVEHLWGLAAKQARAIWGNVEGERFWNSLHGQHVERPQTTKRMFGHSRMLPPDWRTPDKVRICARQLCMSAGRRIRRGHYRASKMSVGLRGVRMHRSSRKDSLRWGWETSFQPARDDNTLLNALSEGLACADRQVTFKPRSVSVMLHGLVAEGDLHSDLFSQPAVVHQKWERVSAVMDQLRITHGPSAVSLGPQEAIPGGYVGAKIAFGRIPELEDFSEAATADEATHFCSFG